MQQSQIYTSYANDTQRLSVAECLQGRFMSRSTSWRMHLYWHWYLLILNKYNYNHFQSFSIQLSQFQNEHQLFVLEASTEALMLLIQDVNSYNTKQQQRYKSPEIQRNLSFTWISLEPYRNVALRFKSWYSTFDWYSGHLLTPHFA